MARRLNVKRPVAIAIARTAQPAQPMRMLAGVLLVSAALTVSPPLALGMIALMLWRSYSA